MIPRYTIAPHLEYFNVPLTDFIAARPEFDAFGVGGFIFERATTTPPPPPTANAGSPPPRILLLQRALTDSMPGCWEGPGGAAEPDEDDTLLDGVVREVAEETGLHVSRIVELVAVDVWMHTRRNGDRIRIAKYSFIVEVYEALRQLADGTTQAVPVDEIPVRLEATEHRAFEWAIEEDVKYSFQTGKGKYQLPLPAVAHQGPNILRAFGLFTELQKGNLV
ncbi:NUDIX domain protein [Penicillium brasilianum]|uniref:NUDIX domain protein n=1 Tax=Penicillium brasilianum TaxID=104259 RepID=A0A1S9RSY4_PENBI|nr:NUDIX domain protein [Penicillium brasilianum]